MLKEAGHEQRVKKVKVKEDDLAPYRDSYEVGPENHISAETCADRTDGHEAAAGRVVIFAYMYMSSHTVQRRTPLLSGRHS